MSLLSEDLARDLGRGGINAAARAHLRDFSLWARGDPRLSSWDEAFLITIARLGRSYRAPLPTEKQEAILRRLEVELGWPDALPIVPDVEPDCCELTEPEEAGFYS